MYFLPKRRFRMRATGDAKCAGTPRLSASSHCFLTFLITRSQPCSFLRYGRHLCRLVGGLGVLGGGALMSPVRSPLPLGVTQQGFL